MWYSSKMRSTRSTCPPTALSRSSTMVWVTRTSEEPSNCAMVAFWPLSSFERKSSMKKVFPAPGGETTNTTQGSGRSSISRSSPRKSPTMLLFGSSSRKSPGILDLKKFMSSEGSRHISRVGQKSYSAMWLGRMAAIFGESRSAVVRMMVERLSGAKEKSHLSRFSEKFQEASTFSKKTKRQVWCRVYSASHLRSASSTMRRPWM
mmetsp:Transcript_141010/g.438369  ORF Transcript_141010/g.438369 Transcript_141010/m.438369 type:complete len:205 (+) Transcript_141010:371-985(+)